jgi:uncharacterized protein YndB with AHSA1/START domain
MSAADVGGEQTLRRKGEDHAMTTDLGSTTSVTVQAPIEQVWAALTTPERIKEWFFGVDTRSDWTPGGELVHTGEWQGRPYEDKGTIVRIEPPTLLEHTHWSPMSGVPDEPQHYETVRWRLSERGAATELTVSESNLPSEEARELSEQSWRMALDELRQLLER